MQDKDICVCTDQKDLAPPTASAAEMFQLLPVCGVTFGEISWYSKQAKVEGCTHSCVDICPLGHSSAIWDRFREAGWRVEYER